MILRKRNRRTVWGHSFDWTPEHKTSEEMRPLIFQYDLLGSDCLNRLDELGQGLAAVPPESQAKLPKSDTSKEQTESSHRDLYALLRDHSHRDPNLQELWTQVNTIPDWVDWKQIERGQKVFYRYGGPIVVALTFQSLLGGMGGKRVVETLSRTGGFGVRVARRRLMETFQHLLQVTSDPDSIKPGGAGFASSIRVRFLHAAVRRRILTLVEDHPSYYSVEEYGIPVNDLDSIGTISTFSSTLIWISLPRQGIWLCQQEIADYIALWRWVAYLLGTPDEPFSTPQKAKAIMESLLLAELQPTATGRILANNIITGLCSQPPAWASREFLCAEAHWLNGRALADELAIQRPRLYHTALVAGQCIFFMFMCYVYRNVPSWDERKNERLRKILYNLTIRNTEMGGLGKETTFDFKYIPRLDLTTEPGQPGDSGIGRSGVERRNLKALLLASVAIGVLAWLVMKGASSMLSILLSLQGNHTWN